MIELLVNIDVDDLERGVEFYTRDLGLEVGRRLEAFSAVEWTGAGSCDASSPEKAGSLT
jgi:catechol 2,3-dioxygenase-like lactoylglutathione lyase family enzyme